MSTIFSVKTVKAALLVGSLDILAACIQFYLKTNKGPAPVFKFIASGIFGEKAFAEESSMIFFGLLFHFFIAFVFTAFFFWACNKFPAILKMKVAAGIVFGVFVWAVMNLVVLPISHAPGIPFNFWGAAVQVTILIACVGMPLSFIAANDSVKK